MLDRILNPGDTCILSQPKRDRYNIMKKRILLTIFLIIFSAFSLTAHEKLHLKIGTYENSPKIFTNEYGEIKGFWADITKYIAQQEDWEIEWVHGNWNECLQRLENNEIDIMVDVGLTPSRQERFAFSNETVLLSWTRIYTSTGSDIQTVLDLEGKKIAGLKGSFDLDGPEGLKAVTKKFEVDCEIIEMEDYLKIFQALEDNEIDAGITDKDFGNINDINFNIERTPIIFQPAHMQFAFSKDSELTPHLIERIDYQINKLTNDKNSIYYRSMDDYLVGLKKITIFPLWMKIIIAIIFFLIIIIFIFNRILKQQVNQKTKELRLGITERKQAEEDLRESEERYRSLVTNLPVGIFRSTLQGEMISVNTAMVEIYGYESVEELLSIPAEDYYTLRDSRDIMLKELEKQGYLLEYETQEKRKDNSLIWVSTNYKKVWIEDGGIYYIDGVVADITTRKQAEEKIRKSEEQFRLFAENVPGVVSIYEWHPDGHREYIYQGPGLKEILGEELNKKIDKDPDAYFRLIPEEDYKALDEASLRAIKTNGQLDFEYRLKIDDSNIKWIRSLFSIFRKENGVILWQGIIYDITERKQAEEALKESEEKYRLIFESFQDIYYRANNKGIITELSPSVFKISGYKPDELIGKPVTKVYQDTVDRINLLTVLKEFGKVTDYELKLMTKDKKVKIGSICSHLIIGQDGEIKGIEGVIRDITERKQAEEELEKNEQFLNSILESVQDGVSALNPDLTVSHVNGVMNKWYKENLPLEGKKCYEVYHNADKPCKPCPSLRCLKSGKTEWNVVPGPPSSPVEWIELFSYPIKDSNSGKITGVVEFVRDITEIKKKEEKLKENSLELKKQYENSEKQRIATLSVLSDLNETTKVLRLEITERKQTEETLKQSEAQYKDLAEKGNIAIVVDDIDGNLLYYNKQFSDLFGYSMEQMKKRNHKTLIHPDDFKRVSHFHKNHIQGRKILSRYEFKGVKKDGTAIDIEISVSRIIEKDNKIIGTRSYLWNITERKRSQAIQKTLYKISNALNTTDKMHDLYSKIREFLGNVIDTTNFYVALYDERTDMISLPFDVDEKDDYETFPAGKTLTKYVIQTGKSLFAPKQLQNELAEQGKIEIIGTRSEIWLGVPLKVENKIIGVIVVQSYDNPNLYSEKDIDILTFISEEIALVIQHIQADEQIRRELKEKEVLLREVHHRVKNNLQVISGLLQLQQNEITTKEDALKGFAASQDRILAMAKAYELLLGSEYMSEVSVGKYITSLTEQLKNNYDIQKKVTISYSFDDLTISIEILDRLGLILNEIITNAIKYAFEGRNSGKIHIELKDAEDHMEIKISDNGIGIPPKIKVHEPATLGLSIVDMLTQQLQGTLKIDRKNGTSFTLVIPKELNN